MEKIDWRKAPNGATHYRMGSVLPWRMLEDGEWYCWEPDEENWIAISDPMPEQYLPIDDHAEWTGEGLPPAGTVCEWAHAGQWLKVEVAYLSEWLIVLRDTRKDESGLIDTEGVEIAIYHWQEDAPVFRPIRTPEQIAAEEREKVVQEMDQALAYASSGNHPMSALYALYDAGYRKVTP